MNQLAPSRPLQRPRCSFWLSPTVLGSFWLICGLASAAPPNAVKIADRAAWTVLADRCLACHGPDAARRKADLRLDSRESLLAEHPGGATVVPERPDESELLRRIASDDPAERMPPPGHGERLTPQEVTLVRQWIERGAERPPHWSFVPPQRQPLPQVGRGDWPRRPLDYWVLAPLEATGQRVANEASKATLLRRLSLDLTGLPPSRPLRDWFLRARDPDAYEQLVERLLASPQFGERLALYWLDAARYADTNGYFTDGERSMWRWRDGLLAALNANQPFDQFTVEQLAGDLLPEASEVQRIASGFHRNHPTNNETGLIDEEYRLSYAMDRLETTGTVWLGLTLNCARCHSHKFDPISQAEYYQLLAYFNQVTDQGLGQEGNSPPLIPAPTAEQLEDLRTAEAALSTALRNWQAIEGKVEQREQEWLASLPRPVDGAPRQGEVLYLGFAVSAATPRDEGPPAQPPELSLPPPLQWVGDRPQSPPPGIREWAGSFDGSSHVRAVTPEYFDWERDQPFSISLWFHPSSSAAGCLISKTDEGEFLRGFDMLYEKGRVVVHLNHRAEADAIRVKSRQPVGGDWQHVTVAYDGSSRASGLRLYLNGRPSPWIVEVDNLHHTIRTPAAFQVGRRGDSLGFTGRIDEVRVVDRAITPEEAQALFLEESTSNALSASADQRTSTQRRWLRAACLLDSPDEWRERHDQWQLAAERVDELKRRLPTTMVMQELAEPRVTRVLTRGQYDQPQESVEAGLPAVLATDGAAPGSTRLALARWLVSPAQPLTARVLVNRAWSQLFGVGLVKTAADFGVQGEAPSHPELLDQLALELVDSGWDVKQLYRSIVTSATYRQESAASREAWESDPENRRLARGPRVRLEAEAIRDTALEVSGLLISRVGGPSVRPWQPPGLWEAVSYNGDHSYEPGTGPDRFRRSLYTFWKRQSPPPTSLIWDSPTRETCLVQRARTNTPLQALALLNEQLTTVATRAWSARLLLERPGTPLAEILTEAWRELLTREPLPAERNLLQDLWNSQLTALKRDPDQVERLLTTGLQPGEFPAEARHLDRVEWATLSTVLQALLSLDEAITKE